MCGRFAFMPLHAPLKYQFGLDEFIDYTPRYNTPPGSSILFLCLSEEHVVRSLMLTWGLIPFWVRELKKALPLTNLRAETLFSKSGFRDCLQSKRGIVVMNGFFEWRLEEGVKQPYS